MVIVVIVVIVVIQPDIILIEFSYSLIYILKNMVCGDLKIRSKLV